MLILNIIGVQYLQIVVFSIKTTPCQIPTVRLKKFRIKISHFRLELILSAKIYILETWYNWSSDIIKHFFIFRT